MMEFEEYMNSLTEQIHDKRAKRLVAQEIQNHIEEQAEAYEADGMTHLAAMQEAVRQMGNPVETGIELNKIHKPKMPWLMLGLVLLMMVAAIIMQGVIFAEGAAVYENGGSLFGRTLLYNAVGFAVILLLLYVDYNFIGKYAYQLYAAFLIGLPVGLLFVTVLLTKFVSGTTIYYGIQMLFPIVFAGLIYQNRNRGIKGILICLALGFTEIVWYGTVETILGNSYGYHNHNAANAETVLILLSLLGISVSKGIFGKDRKKQYRCLASCLGMLVAASTGILLWASGMGSYVWRRVENIFTRTDDSYMNVLLREAIAQADWLGGQSFLSGTPNKETYTLFTLNGAVTYFGKLAGVAMIAVYLLFLVMALRMSLKQTNRIGGLVGSACTISILVRFAAYIAINTGCGLWWTTLVPFFSYGKVSAVMNGIYIGLILCVYRNSSILREDEIPQKKWKKIRLLIE